MRKILIIVPLLLAGFSLFAQEVSEESVVINVEVPVRVFQGNMFIDNLTIDDFELFEDGKSQRIEAVYLVKKRTIERSEEKRRFSPETTRHFYLFFELTEYTAEIGKAIDYFVQEVLYPGDYLTAVTPIKTYRMRGKALEVKSRDDIAKQLKGLLRKDALMSSGEYRRLIAELEALTKTLSEDYEQIEMARMQHDTQSSEEFKERTIDERLMRYGAVMSELEHLRRINQATLVDFAEYLGNMEGQKYVYMVYQREFIPKIKMKVLQYFESMYEDRPNIMHTIANVFEFYRRDITFDVDLVKKKYADSSVAIHFLFMSSPKVPVYGVDMVEQSEDIYAAFKEMARATGGYVESSANPKFLFEQAVQASQNYYLIYYSPKNYKKDGKFKDIRVVVKTEEGVRVTHRLGYFAN
jgi:VWFA-related protein